LKIGDKNFVEDFMSHILVAAIIPSGHEIMQVRLIEV